MLMKLLGNCHQYWPKRDNWPLLRRDEQMSVHLLAQNKVQTPVEALLCLYWRDFYSELTSGIHNFGHMSDFTIVQISSVLVNWFLVQAVGQRGSHSTFQPWQPRCFSASNGHPEVTVIHPISSDFQSPGFVLLDVYPEFLARVSTDSCVCISCQVDALYKRWGSLCMASVILWHPQGLPTASRKKKAHTPHNVVASLLSTIILSTERR